MDMPQYWLLGAMWKDEGVYDDQLPMFLLRGHWILGWPKGEQPLYDERVAKMKVHDRIAIKSMDGKGADTVTIKALGMVKNIDEKHGIVYVNWLLSDFERHVPAHGCFGTVHGPYEENSPWVHEVFHI
jgi:hypothetical protein